jgi:hypothetical protein
MNRITVLSRFSRVPTVTRSVHNVNFAKKTTQFLADLKKQEEAKIQEIDLELTYLKNDLRDVRKIVNSLQTLPAQKGTNYTSNAHTSRNNNWRLFGLTFPVRKINR